MLVCSTAGKSLGRELANSPGSGFLENNVFTVARAQATPFRS
jgi:hypothetical protein